MKRQSHHLVLMIAISILGSPIGCSRHGRDVATSSDDPSVIDTLGRTTDDNQVLVAVLTDLTHCDTDDLPLSLIRKTPRDVYFVSSPVGRAPTPLRPIDHNHGWQELEHLDRKRIDSAIKDLQQRHDENNIIDAFDPGHDLIHVIDAPKRIQDAGDNVPYGALYPIQAWLPGYSSNRDYAVIHLYFSELWHPSYATYVLTKNATGWHIDFRGFMTYL